LVYFEDQPLREQSIYGLNAGMNAKRSEGPWVRRLMSVFLLLAYSILFLPIIGGRGLSLLQSLHAATADSSERSSSPLTPNNLLRFSGENNRAGDDAPLAAGPLRPLRENPRYFTDGSKRAILLAGSHTWSNGMEDRGTVNTPPAFDYQGYMKFMRSHNYNWMRLWTSEMTRASFADDPAETVIVGPLKWSRSSACCASDGGKKFDLRDLDPAYFDRLRSRVIQAGQNGIYVSVMLFNGYMWQFDEIANDGNPFEQENNINEINCGGVCPSDQSQLPREAWTFEQHYLRKVVDTVNDLPNVMFEVSNEAGSPYSDVWQANIIRYVKQYEASKPYQHPVGMTSQFKGGTDATLYHSEADWISPGTALPPEANGSKIVINDTDHSLYWVKMQSIGQKAQREWAWQNFTRGNNLAFMDPYLVRWPKRNRCSGTTADPFVCTRLDPYWDEIRNALTDIRTYSTKVDLARMTPQQDLSSSGFCLANRGSEYLVFSPKNVFELSTEPGQYNYEWFDPSQHQVVKTGSLPVGTRHRFTAPLSGDVVLWLHK
jgi:hypothetical protein